MKNNMESVAGFRSESKVMKLLNSLGLEGLAWSLRRLHCPVSREALVLDVGSGGNPYPRANVLVDAYEETVERYFAPLVKDRPIVFGLAERLPFKDKVFDFVIASHVLEHSKNPDTFLAELMRVGKAGYIETPDAFFERINPFRFHRLEVTNDASGLLIYKKSSWCHDPEIVKLYERKVKDKKFIQFLSKHPAPFYTRFYWNERIAYQVLNPEDDCAWDIVARADLNEVEFKVGNIVRRLVVRVSRYVFSQNRRNKALQLIDMLGCPSCRSSELKQHAGYVCCEQCGTEYVLKNGIPVMYPQVAEG